MLSGVMSAAQTTCSDKLLSLLPGDAAQSRPSSSLQPPASAPEPRSSPHVCLQTISGEGREGLRGPKASSPLSSPHALNGPHSAEQ